MPPAQKKKTKGSGAGATLSSSSASSSFAAAGHGSLAPRKTNPSTAAYTVNTSKASVKQSQPDLSSFFVKKPAAEKAVPEREAVRRPSLSNTGTTLQAGQSAQDLSESLPLPPRQPSTPESSTELVNDNTVADVASVTNDRSTLTPTKPRQIQKPLPRTPTDLSKRAKADSLGLSPEQSVFWQRTPPMEALKKLSRTHSERSHEDDIASIIGRLYPKASSDSSTRSIDGKPKNLIRAMIDSHRGRSSTGVDTDVNDALDDLSDWDPTSPTTSLVDRHRGLARHKSVQDVSSEPRRRDPSGRRTLSGLGTSTLVRAESSTKKSREDTLRMIEHLKSSFRCTPSQSSYPVPLTLVARTQTGSEERDINMSTTSPPRKILRLSQQRPVAEDMIPVTPPRAPKYREQQQQQQQQSPNEYDSVFSDFNMDDQVLDELILIETQSASMSSSSCNTTTISEPASSGSSYVGRNPSANRSELVELGAQVRKLDVKEGTVGVPTNDAFPHTTAEGFIEPVDDDFDDFDGLEDAMNDLDDSDGLDDLGDLGDLADLDDDFEQSGILDQKAAIAAMSQTAKYLRYTVLDVIGDLTNKDPFGRSKVVLGRMQGSENQYTIHLSGSWTATKVAAGDVVHVVNARMETGEANKLWIDDTQGYLIVKPDYLVPTSALSQSFACIRRPIIELRTRRPNESSAAMIHGTIIHELFQQSLRENDFSTGAMKARVEELLTAHLNDLCLVDESIGTVRELLLDQIPACQDWARRFLRNSPSNEGSVVDPTGYSNGKTLLCVNKILDIEENIWSPMFGLKGKIDASIQVTVQSQDGLRTLTVPFELKTGKKTNVVDHRAQTMLYTLLMTDRYNVDVQWGLLFYLRSGEFIRVPAPQQEIRVILMQRNEVAFYEGQTMSMPPMIKSEQKCKWCFSFSSCTVLHKLLEGGTAESSGIGVMFDEATDHLNETHAEFLSKWNRLLTLEQGDATKFQSQIWALQEGDRLASGDSLGGLQLIDTGNEQNESWTKNRFGQFQYTFKLGTPSSMMSQQSLSQALQSGLSLMSSNIGVGDPIVLSSERQHYALAIGQVLALTMSQITVGLDKPLVGPPLKQAGFNYWSNQSYRGLIEVSSETGSLVTNPTNPEDYHERLAKDGVLFRIDKDEMTAGIARTRNNLVQLFRADAHGGDSKRRELVVDLRKPVFDEFMATATQESSNLNSDQMRTIKKVLSSRDYALILGMPGTGKTTTIAELIHTLVDRGQSVLLTSYTHTAVDNVLLKLHHGINTVRLGNKDKVHRDIQQLVPDFTQAPLNTPEAIHNFYGRCQVVGTTCLGIGDPLFTEKRFDYCIVDEASQITLPVCLGPIRYADVFVLVGDHNQLPPLVKNVEARKSGYDQSLFKILSDHHPEAVTSLTQQYRMNKDVMLLSNTLVYQNELQCANEEVANKVLNIPNMEGFHRRVHGHSEIGVAGSSSAAQSSTPCHGGPECWLEMVLDESHSVFFIDTDSVPAREVRVGQSTQNPTEALIVWQLTEALISAGISESDIGIISVLRAQLKVLSRLFAARPSLDIHTVDRYQGKDKDCVIVSLVRSNEEQHVGELLKDWRRINVAFTRAKKKLIVVGSRQTLQGSNVFEQFLRLIERQDWVLKLAPMAQHLHPALARTNLSNVLFQAATSVDATDDKENRFESEEAGSLRRPKVARVSAEAILKNMPTIKTILNGM
ncbi:Tripartite DNA replication factor [Gryganskiella cystojenkinii]|nr:Tripartite DNA replication factor [Gryganskiella cystojenkinii]